MKTLLGTLFLWIGVSISVAATALVQFDVLNGETELEMSLVPGDTDTTTLSYSGSLLGEVSFDDETLLPTEFTFVGGSLSMEHEPISVSATINYVGVGERFTTITISSSGVVLFPSTSPQPGPFVDGTNQMVPGTQNLTANQGTITVTVRIGSISEQLNEDYSLFPSQDDDAEIFLHITELSRTPLERNLRFELSTSYDVSETERIEGTLTDLALSEKGTLSGVGFATIPGQFAQWLIDEELDPETAGDFNAASLPYALLYAFDLPAKASRLPIDGYFDWGLASFVLELDLPESGLRATVAPEFSSSLLPDSWQAFPSESIFNDTGSLSKGATGLARLVLSEEAAVFVRFTANLAGD